MTFIQQRARAVGRYSTALAFWVVVPFLVLLSVASTAPAKETTSSEDIRNSVVRIDVTRAGHDWTAPWKLRTTESISGTGFVIEGGLLLTNAHVVRDAQQVTVKKNDGSAPSLAKVEAVDDGCDLAVISVENKAFLRGMHALRVGDLPEVGSNVVTYGYPLGGLELSTTAGIVSRIENHGYLDGLARHLVVQTDAALNPGNSGGPVVQQGSVVGVAFQVAAGAQSVGFFIPVPIVRHFLSDFSSGHYAGFPDVPLRALPLSSPAYRRERKLPDDRSGVVVQEIASASDLASVLSTGDVLMAVDGQRVADDGTCQLGGTRVPFTHLIDMKVPGQVVRFEAWRDGKTVTAQWKTSRFAPWDQLRRSRSTPRYLVYAGMLFVPATPEYFAALAPTGANRAAILHELVFRQWESPGVADREMVLLAHVFSDPATEGVDHSVPFIVEKVNGQDIRNLSDLARVLDESQKTRDVFQLGPFHHVEAIDRERARASRASILENYGITNARSL